MLSVYAVPAFKDNYIWLIVDAESSAAAVVDPGDAKPVIAALERLSLLPVAILITHHHWDHTNGISALLEYYHPLQLKVYGPASEAIAGLTHPLRENDQVQLPELGVELQVLDVPGHTQGGIAYHGADALFCGDTLFTAGCGKLFEGTPQQMHASLSKFAALPATTRVYCGHEYTLDNLGFARVVEPDNAAIRARINVVAALRASGLPSVPSTLECERNTNPFLRCAVPEVVAAARNYTGKPLLNAADVFAAVRYWKDVLDG